MEGVILLFGPERPPQTSSLVPFAFPLEWPMRWTVTIALFFVSFVFLSPSRRQLGSCIFAFHPALQCVSNGGDKADSLINQVASLTLCGSKSKLENKGGKFSAGSKRSRFRWEWLEYARRQPHKRAKTRLTTEFRAPTGCEASQVTTSYCC